MNVPRIITCVATANDCYKEGRTITPLGIMLHSSGCNLPMVSRYVHPKEHDGKLVKIIGEVECAGFMNREGAYVCYHAVIGKLAHGVGAVNTLPWNYRGWHAGTGSLGVSANDTHVSINILENDLKGTSYLASTYRIAASLAANICKEYGLDPMEKGVVISHAEGYCLGIASNRNEVERWLQKINKSMDTFRKDVSNLLKRGGV